MKKTFMLFSIISILSLLSGCISIPLGDGGTLEVTKDGLSIDEGKVASEAEAESDDSEVAELDTDVPDEEVEVEVEKKEQVATGSEAASANSCDDLIEDLRGHEWHI